MAKTKRADNKFDPGRRFLGRLISVRWTSLPEVDPDVPGLMIQVKLAMLCSMPVKKNSRLCGLQAVVYIPVKKVRGHLEAEGSQGGVSCRTCGNPCWGRVSGPRAPSKKDCRSELKTRAFP